MLELPKPAPALEGGTTLDCKGLIDSYLPAGDPFVMGVFSSIPISNGSWGRGGEEKTSKDLNLREINRGCGERRGKVKYWKSRGKIKLGSYQY